MVAFGTLKKDSKLGQGSDGDWLRNWMAGDTKVRFIDEVDEWIVFREHYNEKKRWFPCTQDKECVGCSSPNESISKRSTKYATNVYLVDRGDVVPMKIPVTLANRLETRSERNDGTITNRDYIIIRTGSGLDTEYDVEQEDKYEAPIKEYQAKGVDIEAILVKQYAEEGAEEVLELAVKKDRKGEKEEFPFKKPAVEAPASVDLGEEMVRKMSLTELTELAKNASVDISDLENKSDIADALVEALS